MQSSRELIRLIGPDGPFRQCASLPATQMSRSLDSCRQGVHVFILHPAMQGVKSPLPWVRYFKLRGLQFAWWMMVELFTTGGFKL